MCSNVTYAPCFLIRKYAAKSDCSGSPLSTRANYCDECKGADPLDYENMQKRTCSFTPNGQNVSSVSYFDCAGENGTTTCQGCAAEPAAVYPLNECVTVGDNDWRLEWSSLNCPLMSHVNYKDTNCKDFWWGDRIVLNQCNDGWQFECPGV
jgi:hypothetical protein